MINAANNIVIRISKQPYRYLFSCLLIVLLTFAIYAQTLGFGLVDYDDYVYIGHNQHYLEGFTNANFIWSVAYFLNFNWAPLVIWSYIADASLYGDWYGGYHLTNLILHALNGLLLYFIALKLSNRQALSLLLAVLFIVHPQHVESVAWLSQRKDLLSAFFMFLSMLGYVVYKTKGVRHYYLLSISAFMLGLMAKVIIAPLPVVLMLFDYVFFSGGVGERNAKYFFKLFLDKWPYILLALLFGGINYYAQLTTGALGHGAAMPADIRLSNIPLAYWFYPIKTVLPYNLIPFYPYPKEAPWLLASAAFIALIGVTVWLYLYRNKYRYLFFGWFCYLILSTPMNGIFQTGEHAYADRYSYLANIGLLIMVIALLVGLTRVIPRKAITAFVVAVAVTLSYLSYAQAALWKDTYTLFSHTLEVSPDNRLALLRIANELVKNKKINEAKNYVDIAIARHPLDSHVYWFGVRYYYTTKEYDAAKILLESALDLDVWKKGVIYREMAHYYELQGDYERALKNASIATSYTHELASAFYVRGSIYMKMGNYTDAISDLLRVISIDHQHTDSYINLGNVFISIGREQEAMHFYQEALNQKPGHAQLQKQIDLLVKKYGSKSRY